MLSLKVDTQANNVPTHVFSDWSLGSSIDSSLGSLRPSFTAALNASLDAIVVEDAQRKKLPCEELHFHNNTIPFTVHSSQMAAYSPMEDKLYVNETENMYGIYDGHGGDICSRFVADRLPKQIMSSLKTRKAQTDSDYISSIKSSFIRVDEQFLTEHRYIVKTSASGSCGVTVLIRNDTLIIGNLGDSRVLLGSCKDSSWSHELLTNDHNTKNEKERELVKQRTSDPMPIRGHVTNRVPGERIGGVLMVTRAFGDGIFKRRDMSLAPFIPYLPYITNEPEVSTHKITQTDRFAVISSDGLYEYLTPAEVTSIVSKQLETTKDGSKIGAALIEYQFEKVAVLANKTVDEIKAIRNRKEFMDDISIIIILFSPSSFPTSTPNPSVTGAAAL